jgi:hypothetical protein
MLLCSYKAINSYRCCIFKDITFFKCVLFQRKPVVAARWNSPLTPHAFAIYLGNPAWLWTNQQRGDRKLCASQEAAMHGARLKRIRGEKPCSNPAAQLRVGVAGRERKLVGPAGLEPAT